MKDLFSKREVSLPSFGSVIGIRRRMQQSMTTTEEEENRLSITEKSALATLETKMDTALTTTQMARFLALKLKEDGALSTYASPTHPTSRA